MAYAPRIAMTSVYRVWRQEKDDPFSNEGFESEREDISRLVVDWMLLTVLTYLGFLLA